MMSSLGMGGGAQQPQEMPTPAPLPDGTDDPNQGIILAAILGGSAILGIALGCSLFRNKRGGGGDSDEDMDSDDESDDDSDNS